MTETVHRTFRDRLIEALTSRPISWPFRGLLRHHATIFMFHRFSDPERGIVGHRPDDVRRFLTEVRRRDYPVVSMRELVQRLREGRHDLDGALVFTLDDGYAEQASVAAPIFAEFEIPVTAFVVTGFVSGDLWLWWDKVEFVVGESPCESLEMEVGGQVISFPLTSSASRAAARREITELLKGLGADELTEALDALARAAAVEIPARPPERFRPMSWEEARRCEALGMEFGPHSVSHPILSRSLDPRPEILDSQARLESEVERPVPVFCYPNGQVGDFGPREIGIIAGSGFEAALTSVEGFVDAGGVRRTSDLFSLPRFSFPHRLSHALRYASGLERAKDLMRGG